MSERPSFDENQIAYRNEFNARAGRGKIPACALVVRFIVICGGSMRREPFPRRNFWRDLGRKKSQKLAAKMKGGGAGLSASLFSPAGEAGGFKGGWHRGVWL